MNLGEILAGGQERRKKLDQTLGETLNYYLGPTGIPQRLAALGVLNPVNDMEQASQKAKTVFSPDATGRERLDAGVGMVTDMATVLAPAAATNRVGGDATAAVVDSLLGIGQPTREGLQDAGRRFAGDERGAIGRTRTGDSVWADVSVKNEGNGLYSVFSDGTPAGDIRIAGNGAKDFVERSQLNPEFQGKRIGHQAYNLIEQDLGRRLVPSPLGLSENGNAFWQRRIKDYEPDEVVDAYRRSYETGLGYGIPDRDIRMRLYGVGGSDALDALKPPSKADEIARLLREGRAEEITDDMMAALDPNDQMRLFKLYEDGATGMPMPMDEASRMARARNMGFTDDAYHATSKEFAQFIPSEFRGASFFGPTPEGATKGASASANEGVGSGTGIIIPARVNTSGVRGLGAYDQRNMNEFRKSLPDRIYTEQEVDALMASDAAPGRGDWTYFFDDLTDYDALRTFRDNNPDAPIPDGIIKFRPKASLQYSPDLKLDLTGRQFAHYSEGMSERPSSNYTKEQGNTGFTMQDESGLALAVTDPTTIRSRFARFDPRLKHLANLSAAGAGAVPLGALLANYDQDAEQRKLRDYLQQ